MIRSYAGDEPLIAAVEDPATRMWHLSWGQCLSEDGVPSPCQYALCAVHIKHLDMFTYPRQVYTTPALMNKTLAKVAPNVHRCTECFSKTIEWEKAHARKARV